MDGGGWKAGLSPLLLRLIVNLCELHRALQSQAETPAAVGALPGLSEPRASLDSEAGAAIWAGTLHFLSLNLSCEPLVVFGTVKVQQFTASLLVLQQDDPAGPAIRNLTAKPRWLMGSHGFG